MCSCEYQCKFCHFKFIRSEPFERHLSNTHQREIQRRRADREWSTFQSESKNMEQSKIDVQVNIGLRSPFPVEVNQYKSAHETDTQSIDRDRNGNAFSCTKCSSKFRSLELLRIHNRDRHSFDCVHCPNDGVKAFETEKGLLFKSIESISKHRIN